jgi:hypothetical protein
MHNSRTRLVFVNGFLGAGKTTTIAALARMLAASPSSGTPASAPAGQAPSRRGRRGRRRASRRDGGVPRGHAIVLAFSRRAR